MSAAKHTPGPWHAREWQCHAATSVGRDVDGRFEQIAECSSLGRQVPNEQEEADARLVAAAPKLLAALEAFQIKEEWIVAGTAKDIVLRVPLAVIQQAAAAIAEARGAAT